MLSGMEITFPDTRCNVTDSLLYSKIYSQNPGHEIRKVSQRWYTLTLNIEMDSP